MAEYVVSVRIDVCEETNRRAKSLRVEMPRVTLLSRDALMKFVRGTFSQLHDPLGAAWENAFAKAIPALDRGFEECRRAHGAVQLLQEQLKEELRRQVSQNQKRS